MSGCDVDLDAARLAFFGKELGIGKPDPIIKSVSHPVISS